MTRPRASTTAESGAWSYIAGERGSNRVRVFIQPTRSETIYIDYRTEEGARVKRSLGHGDRERAKLEADQVAAKFRRAESRAPVVTTLARLFEIYEREVTPSKALETQRYDRRTFPLLKKAFGGDRRPETLNVRDWTSFITRRRKGELAHEGREGKAVRARIIEQDCKLLLAVLNWAERARDDRGAYLLEKNPLRGLAVPREESPRRPVMTPELFTTVRAKAAEISTSAELFVCLLSFTGHRSGSIRQLRWEDIDLVAKTVRWRAEVDKIGYDHRNPLHSELIPLLEQSRAVAELTGDAWLFPMPDDVSKPMTRAMAAKLWRKIADASGIKAGSRLAMHSFRRAFANRLRDVPLRELKDLGGWKTEKTVIGTYLQPDEDAQRAALSRL